MPPTYFCQICGMDMAIARIRTSDEPTTAAWDYTGCNYVGFEPFRDYHNNDVEDSDCQECTTVDRTPPIFRRDISDEFGYSDGQIGSGEDADWLPDGESGTDSEPLEFDSDADAGSDDLAGSHDCDITDTDSETYRDALRDIYVAPLKDHPPHGTWDGKESFLYRAGRGHQYLKDMLQDQEDGPPRFPLEHIASPSCQSVQGINGHKLSLAEMKGCRTHRFLIPRPSSHVPRDWKSEEAVDGFLEKDSLFVLSGEANGSVDWFDCQYVYPPRYEMDKVVVTSDNANSDMKNSWSWAPLPVHSYCLDIYAKVSYRQLGHFDLHDIWHWREMCNNPNDYGFAIDAACFKNGIGKEDNVSPFHHRIGNEWMAANPVEIPGLAEILEESLVKGAPGAAAKPTHSHLLALPVELLDNVFVYLDDPSVTAIAATCRTLRHHAQPLYQQRVIRDMSWLWEVFEGKAYPASPDRPATWDPCNPPGLDSPEYPFGLEQAETETKIWAEIVADDQEMREIGAATQMVNSIRREALLGTYYTKVAWSLREWQAHRTAVEDWICSSPSDDRQHTRDVNWIHLWHSIMPRKSSLPGLRNREQILKQCERIMGYIDQLRKLEQWDSYKDLDREAMDRYTDWWERTVEYPQGTYPEQHAGFLRKRVWEHEYVRETTSIRRGLAGQCW